jgi:hypothetical protein
MKSANRNNGKKVNLNKNPRRGVKFSRLSPAITQCCLVGAFGLFPWLSRLFGDGLNNNHNEMFLADRN